MAQMQSYYITNTKTELKFSSGDLNENELEVAMQEITLAMLNNDDPFREDDNNTFFDNESINLDNKNTDDLFITKVMDLDTSDFKDFEEQGEEESSENLNQFQFDNEDTTNIDFEAILSEEFD